MRKLPIEQVKPGMINKKTVLGFLGQVLLCPGVKIKPRHLYYLKQMGLEYLYVEDSRMCGVACQDLISSEVRSEGQALIAGLFRDLDDASYNPRVIDNREKDLDNFVNKVVEELLENDNPVIQISDLRAYAGYLFAHSVNCCVLSALLALQMNYDLNATRLVALGALLHDIGYIKIPRMILRKPGRLSKKEFEMVKSHAGYGYGLFKKTKLFSARVAEIILQHHERMQGQGYPRGLRGKRIGSLARLVAVADVFDAITSDKNYRKAFEAHEAVRMMQRWSKEYFDAEVIAAFVNVAAAYPLGACVMLSSGESGLVVANKVGRASTPTVRILYKDDFIPHPKPYDLNLAESEDVQVIAVTDDYAVF